ncbi:MAG: aldehyde dehydrogenase family protein [Candidatus Omnitrophica bacterium]|nr:aldehyde dehydrogenase family protein [Candidatus Omnitrophota bacterium]MDE2010265.1 aldehyde dehydrogenase family protein [Candidatus Omnitrophota bacterium]MDE2215224.1 aldehyde dehydrogenase family protein [Candidatus Omnitrophota bacterium]MDE2231041.1 aldehyde dehydrogenase family protein [Candidatus Omnitrophota bacterium]
MTTTTGQQFDLLVEGRLSPALSGRYFDCVNPSNGGVFARIADADTVDVQMAVQAARLGFDHGRWPQMGAGDRASFLLKIAALIRENAKELADLECASCGKTIKHATFIDVPTAAETFEYFGNLPGQWINETMRHSAPVLSIFEREPVGVVAAIIPWNYPLIMAAWKLAPALLTGNCVVLKTSPTACAAVMLLAKLAAQAGLPKGVLNIIASKRAQAGEELVGSPFVDMVSFTGSTKTGKAVMALASNSVKKLTLELGGKSPNIVFADCDMEAALGGALSAIFMNQGQMCTAGSRLLVEDKIYHEFVGKLAGRAKNLKIGPADDFETEFGPLVSVEHRDSVLKSIEKGKQEGAKLACGGKIPESNPQGAYLEPTIFVNVRNSMSIAQEEIFGPVLCAIPFSSVEEAIHIANDTKYGLAAMVWSRDLEKANLVARRLRCGTVWINTYGVFLNQAPYGGYKQSGFGRELGLAGLLEYTQIKHIATDQTPGGRSLVTNWF